MGTLGLEDASASVVYWFRPGLFVGVCVLDVRAVGFALAQAWECLGGVAGFSELAHEGTACALTLEHSAVFVGDRPVEPDVEGSFDL